MNSSIRLRSVNRHEMERRHRQGGKMRSQFTTIQEFEAELRRREGAKFDAHVADKALTATDDSLIFNA